MPLSLGLSAGHRVFAAEGPPRETAPGQTLRLGASKSSFPYSYYDNTSEPHGFAVELSNAVARAMDLKFERVPIESRDTLRAITNGDIDVAQFWTETPARAETVAFSVPTLILQTVVVLRDSDESFHSLADLKGRTVAVVAAGSVADTFLREQAPGAKVRHLASSNEVLGMVSNRECDAAVLSRFTALALIEQQGWKNLRVVDPKVGGYDVRYGFAVRKSDTLLLSRLNEGLAILHRTGEYERIYDRWFGRHEKRRFTREQVATYVAAALAVAFAVALWAFIRQRAMARRIASQTAELRQQRTLRDALFESHPLATFLLEAGAHGRPPRLLSLNREAGILSGIDPATAAGATLNTVALMPEVRGFFAQLVDRWHQTESVSHHEIYLRDTQRLLEITLVPLAPGKEGPGRLCLLANDVTARRLADREVAQARRLRALGELTGGIAHEFNNLLTPVLLQTESLRDGRTHDAELIEGLDLVRSATRRAGELTRRLLAFGRRPEDSAESAGFATAVQGCIALLRPTFDRRIAWQTELPKDLPEVGCHATDLHQIVFNLVLNARDTLVEKLEHPPTPEFTARLGLTLLTLPPTAHLPRRTPTGAVLRGWQRLTVEDNGLGISPENLERIFEPFFTTKETGRGTGLGLATVWHAVQESGGLLEVDSIVGEGSRFHVTLPAWEYAPTPAANGEVPGPVPTPPAAVRGLRILLVEDEEMVARTSITLLTKLSHEVRHAADGLAGWEAFRGRPDQFDLIIADLNMPGLNGIDLIARIRETSSNVRVIAMSGRVTEANLRTLEKLHVNQILAKPFTLAEIEAALAACFAS